MINMYMKDNRGDLRHWQIWYEEDELTIFHGIHNGTMQEKREHVEVKGNNTLSEQIQSRIASRCSSMRDKGYVPSMKLALSGKATNQMDMPKPMLATPIKKTYVSEEWFTQYKYDGHRCLVSKKDGRLFAYSRGGKPITTIDHILQKLELNIQEGMILDGELYIHGLSLQKIASLVKAKQPQSADLEYMMYDIMMPEPYELRLDILNVGWPDMVVPTTFQGDYSKSALDAARALGYEGLIVRNNDTGYEDGRRSRSLIKVKKFEDAEFMVVGIHASVDDWAILECITDKDVSFNVSAPGSIPERELTLQNSMHYIGKKVKVEYANLTKDGVPFHPVAITWDHSGLD